MPETENAHQRSPASPPIVFRLAPDAPAERLDKALARLLPEHSRSRLRGWIEHGKVLVNGQTGKRKQAVYPGDELTVWIQASPESLAFTAQDVAFGVIAESPDWIVVDKPAGLVTHPGAGNWSGTLLNGLLFRYPELARVARAGIVHRLDKDTSGLLIVARTETAQTQLVRQLQARTVRREYCALVHGALSGRGTVDAPIGRDARVPVRMSSDRPVAPKPAVTHYESLGIGRSGDAVVSRVLCRLETGRTHQIRVHMARLRHPLLGDTLYGGRHEAGAGRQMLHARALGFDDPASGRPCAFTAEPPDDFRRVLDGIHWEDDGDDGA